MEAAPSVLTTAAAPTWNPKAMPERSARAIRQRIDQVVAATTTTEKNALAVLGWAIHSNKGGSTWPHAAGPKMTTVHAPLDLGKTRNDEAARIEGLTCRAEKRATNARQVASGTIGTPLRLATRVTTSWRTPTASVSRHILARWCGCRAIQLAKASPSVFGSDSTMFESRPVSAGFELIRRLPTTAPASSPVAIEAHGAAGRAAQATASPYVTTAPPTTARRRRSMRSEATCLPCLCTSGSTVSQAEEAPRSRCLANSSLAARDSKVLHTKDTISVEASDGYDAINSKASKTARRTNTAPAAAATTTRSGQESDVKADLKNARSTRRQSKSSDGGFIRTKALNQYR